MLTRNMFEHCNNNYHIKEVTLYLTIKTHGGTLEMTSFYKSQSYAFTVPSSPNLS